MTRLLCVLLTLLFSLSGSAMGANSDFGHFGNVAKGAPRIDVAALDFSTGANKAVFYSGAGQPRKGDVLR